VNFLSSLLRNLEALEQEIKLGIAPNRSVSYITLLPTHLVY
jgi:hypothetical protein